jgi:hypothetical protein
MDEQVGTRLKSKQDQLTTVSKTVPGILVLSKLTNDLGGIIQT